MGKKEKIINKFNIVTDTVCFALQNITEVMLSS